MGAPWRRWHRRRMLRAPVKRSLTSGLDVRFPEVMHMSSTATTVLLGQDDTRSTAGPLGLIRRFPVAALVILTFGLTWLLEIPRVLDARGELPFPFPFWAVILRGWIPVLAAIIVAAATGGRAAIRSLFRRVLIWRVGWPWYVLMIGGTAALLLRAGGVDPAFGGAGLPVPRVS